MPPARALTLVALLVLAGCLSPLAPADSETGTTAVPDSSTPTPTPTNAGDGNTGVQRTRAVETATPQSRNPWGTEPVVVAIHNEGEPDRDFAPMVREATAYWEEVDDRYLGFPVRYAVLPDASNPDIVIRFVKDVPDCGAVADAVGCAPLVTKPAGIDRPETVWIQTGLADDSTTLVVKHELGHTLGLGHDAEPRSVMQAESVLYTEPQPNATDRAFPWADTDFTVRVDARNASDPDGARTQVDHALTYYAEDAPGVPTNITFRRVSAERPEILIRFGETAGCAGPSGSCIATYGTDPDGDGAIETYTRIEITLVGLDTPVVGWHVGYWLAYAFGAEDDAEKPPPFRNATPSERRSAWWE